MEVINVSLSAYAERHTSAESTLLNKINRETHLEVLHPRMLSGHLQGRVLSMLSKMIRPKVILEIGTYTGYSALCLAEGLVNKGKVITIDINRELETRVRKYFAESSFGDQLEFLIGDALELIPGISETLDLVFIDADKINYSKYYDQIIDKLRSGGFIIADNVLWSGKVLSPDKVLDKDAVALKQFNRKVQSDDRVENVLFPVRDGLMVIRKI
jgi:predicted O-methyltransferase YrrM